MMTSTKNLKGQSRETKLISIQRGDRRNLKNKGKGPRWVNKLSYYKYEKILCKTGSMPPVFFHQIIWWLTVLILGGMCHRHSKRRSTDFGLTIWMACRRSLARCPIEGRFSHRPRGLNCIRCSIWKSRNGKAWLRM